LLDSFRLARYRVELEVGPQGLLLPRYKGSTLRGGFGRAFRQMCCAQRQDECHGCLLRETCPYAYVFETAPPAGAQVLRNLENVPRPFVIEPPLETRQEYRPGEKLSFGLVLIGNGIRYLPYFIAGLEELGRIGIGKGRRPYRLGAVYFAGLEGGPQGAEKVVFSAADRTVRDAGVLLTGAEITAGVGPDLGPDTGADTPSTHPDRLQIRFLTMTRLKHGGTFVTTIPFHALVRGLLRRLSSLLYFHHGIEWDVNFAGLIERAKRISTTAENVQWVDWDRYSGRRGTHITMGGLVGTVVYSGDLDEFWPLLKIGEYVHVGKGAVFGMGKYRIG
jgi:hypothetical protein